MNNNKYKISISNKNIYIEFELPSDAKIYRVGTAVDSDYRLHKDLFFEDIRLEFVNDNGNWSLICSDNIYLTSGDTKRLLATNLEHGNLYYVKYQESNNDVFSVEFMADFDNEARFFERRIELINQKITIGNGVENNLVINSEYTLNDKIELIKTTNGLQINIISTTFGVYRNGTKIVHGDIIKETDFLSIADIMFYFRNNALWTEISDKCKVNGLTYVDYPRKMNYPRFVRNTRIGYSIPDEKIGLLVAPTQPKKPQQNLVMTLLPALAMMALTIVVRGFMSESSNNSFIIFSVCSMSMGIVTSIVTYITTKRKYKLECEERINEYNNYIKKKREEIEEARNKEREILEKIYYDTASDIDTILNFKINLFDRIPSDKDYLNIYLGKGEKEAGRAIDYKKPEAFETKDILANIPNEITEEYKMIPDCPITVSLIKHSAIGVLGHEEYSYEMMKLMLVDLITRHYFEDVKAYLLVDDIKKILWAKKLPHLKSKNEIRNVVYDLETRNNIFESLYKELTIRKGLKSCKELPHLVIFVMTDWGIRTHPVSQFIEEAKDLGVTFIFFGHERNEIPLYCGNLIEIHDANTASIIDTSNGNRKEKCKYRGVSDLEMTKIAQIMEPIYCDKVSLESSLRKSISMFELLNIYSVEDINLLKNWQDAQVWNSLAAPIGVNSKNEIISLNLHEKFHGPHGLVAGTTGSGKSEILQTYILSAAILFHPYEVSFVIIDFKGGGMVNQFKELPHLIGAITNIDGREIDRSLKSIKAELLKRQAIFAEANVNHIDKYIQLYKSKKVDVPLPHLVIIVDEFAELKAEQPEFMKELISAARIGRSLGVHLILATQKPSGQVNEQIWSNSKFKLCLKVQNKEDSNEVLKSPLAAEIKEPGRAYLQVGNNEMFELLQSGFSGASEKESNGNERAYYISQVDFSGKKRKIFEKKKSGNKEQSRTQLEAIVQYIGDACIREKIDRLPSICLPPLSDHIPMNEDMSTKQKGFSIGIYDDPDSQYQGEAYINLNNDNYMIIGSSATGKTNLLQVMIRQIVNTYTPQQANIYIMDFGAMYLKNYEALCYVGGVVTISEEEKLKNLFKLIVEEIRNRKEVFMNMGISSYSSYEEGGYRDIPRIFVFIDNYTAFREIYGDTYEEEFLYMIREGITCGINIILANAQTAGLGYKYMSNFAGKIALHCNDSSEYGSLFERCRMKPKEVPGRALCRINKELYETQTYIAFEGEKEIERSSAVKNYIKIINEKYAGYEARKIPTIPEVLTYSYIMDNFRVTRSKYSYPMALDYNEVDVVQLDFEKTNELCIVGNAVERRLSIVKSLINIFKRNMLTERVNIYIVDNIHRQLKDYKDDVCVTEYTLDYGRLGEIIIELEETLVERYNNLLENDANSQMNMPLNCVIINSKDAIDYISSNKSIMEKYTKIMKQYKALGICFIYSELEDVTIPYAAPELMKRFKENKKALITTSKLKDYKFCEVPSTAVRSMKPLENGDVYLLDGAEVFRIKIAEVD